MRHIRITGLALLLMTGFSCRQEKPAGDVNWEEDILGIRGDIRFDRIEHDLGNVIEGETVGYSFTFTNAGEGSLMILDASASCGCTVPTFSKEPIPPGGKGSVEVKFDSSGRSGQQSKTVTVRTNGKDPYVTLTIRANIIEQNS